MGTRTFTFGFGKETQTCELPEEHISTVIEGRPTPAVDVEKATLDCMRHPIGAAPLADQVKTGDKVCIVCADVTRTWNHSEQYVIHIVNELNRAGVPDSDICVLFAQGTHRAQTHEEDIRVVGEEVTRRIRLYQHDSRDKKNLVHVGDTSRGTPVWLNRHVVEADKVIIVDGITIHLFAGYGGGRKLILPGVAGWDTIQINHCHALADHFGDGINPLTRSTKLDNNPVSDDMQEACDMIKPCFLVHSIVNSEGKICAMVGGDPYEAWLAGTKIVYDIQKAPFKEKSDVSFACAGGYPKDVSLYQGCKCYDPADMATKEGGIIIAIMAADDIMEPPEYMGSFHYDTEEAMEKDLRAEFTIPFFVAFNLFCMAHRYTIYLVTRKENFEAIKKTGQIPVATVEEAWSLAKAQLAKEGKTDYTINVMPHATTIIPDLIRK